MSTDNADDPWLGQFLPLNPLEFQILLVLMSGVVHAYQIVRKVEEAQPSWNRILPTNLYRRIWRLADLGLLEEVPGEERSERPRKHFAITALGKRVAVAEMERLKGLVLEAESVGVTSGGGS